MLDERGVMVIAKILTVAFIALAAIGFGAAKISSDVRADRLPDVANSAKWVRVFSDTFGGNSLDTNKWVTCYDWRSSNASGCTNSGNNEQEWYLPSQVTVSNGAANLTAINDPISIPSAGGEVSYPYRSGMISTGRGTPGGQVKWSATYGYFEARMNVSGGQGVWPAFWLLPTDSSWPPEIDIMELVGSQPDTVLLTSHWPSSSGPQKNSSSITGPDFTNGWHTYAVNWQPNRIDWYVDGVVRKTVTGSTVPDKPMEMIFDLAVGGSLPGNADSSTPLPATVHIDYVNVYERKQ